MQESILDAITYVAARYLLNKNVERKNVIFKNCKHVHVHVASFLKWEGGGEQPRPKILDKPNKKQGGGRRGGGSRRNHENPYPWGRELHSVKYFV